MRAPQALLCEKDAETTSEPKAKQTPHHSSSRQPRILRGARTASQTTRARAKARVRPAASPALMTMGSSMYGHTRARPGRNARATLRYGPK